MSKKIINGVTYKLVASAHKDELHFYGNTFCELRDELEMDYLNARPGLDSINKGLAWAKFTFDHLSYWSFLDNYENVLSTILRAETGESPKYREQADLCAAMFSTRFLDTDGYYDYQKSDEVRKFYAERFPESSFGE